MWLDSSPQKLLSRAKIPCVYSKDSWKELVIVPVLPSIAHGIPGSLFALLS